MPRVSGIFPTRLRRARDTPTVFAEPHRLPATPAAAMLRGAWGLPGRARRGGAAHGHPRAGDLYPADSSFPGHTRFEIHRPKARYLARHGRWREARPRGGARWKHRSGSRRAWRELARSLPSRASGRPWPRRPG